MINQKLFLFQFPLFENSVMILHHLLMHQAPMVPLKRNLWLFEMEVRDLTQAAKHDAMSGNVASVCLLKLLKLWRDHSIYNFVLIGF